jgi:SAM-dependent methyltransferase
VGVDVSSSEIEVARRRHASPEVEFQILAAASPKAEFDLAYCNGVFHHISPAERFGALAWIHRALRPGGWFAFWENNPWNPGTRYVMSRIPFDRDARTLNVLAAKRLLASAGFMVAGVSFLFLFPRALAFLRGLEPWVSWAPLGGQYLVLCRKP